MTTDHDRLITSKSWLKKIWEDKYFVLSPNPGHTGRTIWYLMGEGGWGCGEFFSLDIFSRPSLLFEFFPPWDVSHVIALNCLSEIPIFFFEWASLIFFYDRLLAQYFFWEVRSSLDFVFGSLPPPLSPPAPFPSPLSPLSSIKCQVARP